MCVCVTVSGLVLYYSISDDPNAPTAHHLMMLAELGQHGPHVVLLKVCICMCVCMRSKCIRSHVLLCKWETDKRKRKSTRGHLGQDLPPPSPFSFFFLSVSLSLP